MTRLDHEWRFFRAGGVGQVELSQVADLESLAALDQKLWMALAMPTRGVSADIRTLDALDTDLDGKIRPPELIAAVDWLRERIHRLDLVWQASEILSISDLRTERLQAVARETVKKFAGGDTEIVTIAGLEQALQHFSLETFNGDGVIIPECSDVPEIRELLGSILAVYPGQLDRSGKRGVDLATLAQFSKDLDAQLLWHEEGVGMANAMGIEIESLTQACKAWEKVKDKIGDFFTRCRWVRFDARAEGAANRTDNDFVEISKQLLYLEMGALAEFPLAHVSVEGILPLDQRLNPAWQSAMQEFRHDCLNLFVSPATENLSEDQWIFICNKLSAFAGWGKHQPQNPLCTWTLTQLRSVGPDKFKEMEAIILRDEAKNQEYSDLKELFQTLLYGRDLGKILKNFINFSDFYRGAGSVFQVGTLYIDGRSSELCLEVSNPAKHLAISGLSGAFLIYCECHRSGQAPRSIVALLTDGDSEQIIVGRNGVFYDRSGADWDATITRIVANPISLQEAFFLPYRKVVRFIEEQVAKRAALAEASADGDLSSTATAITSTDKNTQPSGSLAKGKIDVGTVAALGVALGSIGTFFGLLFSKFIDLGVLMPFGILALVLLISGPSMLLAWLKLRHRNLGPILDANGWAMNAPARINVAFAASMTQLRTLPLRADLSLPDPYADKKRPWKFYVSLAIFLFLACLWAMGKCDSILPKKMQRQHLESQGVIAPLQEEKDS